MNTKDLQELLRTAEAEESRGNYSETERLAQQVLRELDAEIPALEHSVEALALLALRAEAMRLLGSVAVRRGSLGVALSHSKTALSLAESSGDTVVWANVMNTIGNAYFSMSDFPKALEYYSQALSQHEEVGDKKGVAQETGNIGIVYQSLSDYPKALEYYARALSLYEEADNKRGVARVTGNLGIVYTMLSDFEKALEYFARALSLHEESGDKTGIARVTGNIGSLYRSLCDYPKALEYLGRALLQYDEVEDTRGAIHVTGNIGSVYALLSDFEKALKYYSRALSQCEDFGEKSSMAGLTGNIGLVYAGLADYPKALEYYERALSLHEEVGDKAGLAVVTCNIGIVYTHLTDYPKALDFLTRGMKWQNELGLKNEAANMKTYLGELYASVANQDRDEAKAEEYLRESIAACEELGSKNFDAHKALAEIYKRQHRWQESLEQYERYHELKDHVQSEEAKKTAVHMEQRRQIAEREKEIAVAKAAADAQMSATTKLLYKVLPQSVAARMIEGEEEIADYYTNVSILFADIAGFTPISADMPAIIVVRFLNYVFGEFDRIIKKHGCEKIKTIGDGYMAVCGAPLACEDHAERLATAALEMQETIMLPESIREYMPSGVKLGVRIGLHTGSVVAGVIGEERFVYDIYSDAVNTAARMESHGEENRIHISNDFFRHMQNRFAMTKNTTHGFVFEKRGEMEIKGKGMMRTYFLEKA